MSNQDPWGGVQSNAGGGTVGQGQNLQNARAGSGGSDVFDNGDGTYTSGGGNTNQYSPNDPTGLAGEKDNGHTWNLTDIWGGDNKYGDWSLTPTSFAPQGDSASFYDALAQQYAGRNMALANQAFGQGAQQYGAFMGNQAQQGQMLSMLQNAANGTTPSQAQIQQTQGIQQSIAAQQALANSARGGPGAWAAAQQGARTNMAAQQQSAIQQGAALRAQEMATARGQYASALQQQAAEQMGMQGQVMGQGSQLQGADTQSMMALLGYGQTAGQIANAQENAWNNIVSGATQNNAGNASQAVGSTAAVLGTTLAAMSDERLKTHIGDEAPRGAYERAPSGSSSEEMLSKLHPYSFNYKPGTGENPFVRRYGVMAQDLERSSMGRSVVMNTPRGKAIDVVHAMGAALAGMADMNRRLQRLEGKRG